MKPFRRLVTMMLLMTYGSVCSAQDRKTANPAAVPPNLLVLVHQEIQPGRSGEYQKLLTRMARACDHWEAPSFWIDLQSLTGYREAVSLDPFDSFEHLQEAHTGWRQFLAAHPDLAQTQGELDALVSGERTIVAARRDDLGYLLDNMDLSEARYVRVIEVRLVPGHESDFAEVSHLWSEFYASSKVDKPWAVYQVNAGATSPTFVILMPLADLKENDELPVLGQSMREESQGENNSADRLKQIAREGFVSAENNLYVVRPEMSHVAKEFAVADPAFWKHGAEPEMKSEAQPDVTPSKKKANAKPPQ